MSSAGAEPRLSIVIPVRNEGPNIALAVRLLRSVEVLYEVVVIADSPHDDTLPTVESLGASDGRLRAILNSYGPGIPNALRTGVEASRGEYVLIFVADDPGPVLAIDAMLALMGRGCDLVGTTRYAAGGRRVGGPRAEIILSRIANALFHRVAGSAFTDATNGVKMFRREVFSRLALQAEPVGWSVAFEMAIKAELLGLRIGEVPIVSINRLGGGWSSFALGSWTRAYLRWFIWGAAALRRRDRRIRIERP